MKTIVLLSPNTGGSNKSASMTREHLALGYLAAILQTKGTYDIRIIDARTKGLSGQIVAQQVNDIEPFFLGLSVMSEQAMSWLNDFGAHLQVDSHVCMGGCYPTLQTESAMNMFKFIDSIAIGEGEVTIVELVRVLEAGNSWHHLKGIAARLDNGMIQINPRQPLIPSLDSLPYPMRYVERDDVEIPMEGGRGCFAACSFCSINPQLSHKSTWRARSARNLVDEIKQLRIRFPNRTRYRFVDPDFVGILADANKKRLYEFARLLKTEVERIMFFIETQVMNVDEDLFAELRDAGLREVYLGVESGSVAVLKSMRKISTVEQAIEKTALLRRLGINFEYGHMMITPWTNYVEILDSIKLLKTIGNVQFDKLFNELYLTPGLDLVKQVGREYPLTRRAGDGFYRYIVSPLIENIRAFGIAFEEVYSEFSHGLWLLYKDIQWQEQFGMTKATVYQRQLTDKLLSMFEYCLEASNIGSLLSTSDIYSVIDDLIKDSQEEIQAIRNQLEPSITFVGD